MPAGGRTALREDQDIERKIRYKGVTAAGQSMTQANLADLPIKVQLRVDQRQIDRVILPEISKPPVTIYSPPKIEKVKPVAFSVMSQKVPIYSFAKPKIIRKGLVDPIETQAPEVKKETNIMIFVIAGVAVLGVFLLIRK